MHVVNHDVAKSKILDRLTEARDLSSGLKQDLLTYLIGVALAEAYHAFHGAKQTSALPWEPDESGADS